MPSHSQNERKPSGAPAEDIHRSQMPDPKAEDFLRLQQRYSLALEVSRTITSNLKLDQIFHGVVRGVGSIFLFDRASLVLYQEHNQSFSIYALETASRRYKGTDFIIPRERSNMGWVFETGRYYINLDILSNCRSVEDEFLIKRGIRSYIVLPLLYRDKVIGMFNLGSKAAGTYTDREADLLMHIASQIATAVENARAYEALEEMRDSLYGENVYLREEIKTVYNFDEIVGTSESLRRTLSEARKVAPTDCTVLIRGETGTGKELIARAIHNLSTRRDNPFVRINCAAVPEGLIESELFGYERGAFTGALSRKTGLFEVAGSGTILLDEIGDIPASMQAKILRVLEEKEFIRLGANLTTKVDVRILASTNRDLENAMKEGRFRADLFYRLNAFPLTLPPLRERPEDIPMLASYFVSKYSKLLNKDIRRIDREAMKALTAYAWPGNVREMENVIERAVILCESGKLELKDTLSPAVRPSASGRGPNPTGQLPTLVELERDHIIEVLKKTRGRIYGPYAAAAILGLKPTTLQSRIKKLGISKVSFLNFHAH